MLESEGLYLELNFYGGASLSLSRRLLSSALPLNTCLTLTQSWRNFTLSDAVTDLCSNVMLGS